jgi:hypothetical protein
MIGDLPEADVKPPSNMLFVCKLNPVTTEEDLEIIFSRCVYVLHPSLHCIQPLCVDVHKKDVLGEGAVMAVNGRTCWETVHTAQHGTTHSRWCHCSQRQLPLFKPYRSVLRHQLIRHLVGAIWDVGPLLNLCDVGAFWGANPGCIGILDANA